MTSYSSVPTKEALLILGVGATSQRALVAGSVQSHIQRNLAIQQP